MSRLSDKAQKAQGKVIRMGISQIVNPTPQWMKYILRTISFLSGIYALLPQDLFHLTTQQWGNLNKWVILTNSVIAFVIKFFGWDYKSK